MLKLMMKTRELMKKMINDAELLCIAECLSRGEQKRLNVESSLSIYFGLDVDGHYRLSFVSTKKAPCLESTKNIRISQGQDKTKVYWLNFDLLAIEQQSVFFSFCENLVSSVLFTIAEEDAFYSMKKQYSKWKALFRNEIVTEVSREVIQGVFGELFFLKNYMIPTYGVEKAVNAWSGTERTSKDFSIESMWYEVKTIGAKSPTITITSLTQLDSNYEGRLAVCRVELMSEESRMKCLCIKDLFDEINSLFENELLEGLFFEKLANTGVVLSDKAMNMRFLVRSLVQYKVDTCFPKLTERNLPYAEICDVEYKLSLKAIKNFEVTND